MPAVPVAAPVLEGTRYSGRPIYYADVIVHRESPWNSFLDLRGRSWACNEPLSHSGYGMARYHLVELGETRGFFGRVIESGSHGASMRLVADRQADGAAIDSQVLAVALRDDPRLARSLRVVEALGPSSIPPMAVSLRVPPPLRRQITTIVTTLHDDPAVRARLALGLVRRFVAVEPASYDDVRFMRDACEAAGFLQIR